MGQPACIRDQISEIRDQRSEIRDQRSGFNLFNLFFESEILSFLLALITKQQQKPQRQKLAKTTKSKNASPIKSEVCELGVSASEN